MSRLTHWTSLDPNPNAVAVQRFLRDQLAQRKRGRIDDIQAFLKSFVSDRSVLDIGVVQHDVSQIGMPHWKHGKVRGWASRCLGVDLLQEGVAELQRRGYDVRCVDATSEVDLGERFERVVIGDVIEHVDNPVALLRFAGRHLAGDGLVLCTTPNPFFLPYLVESLRRGSYIPNAEHVSWVTPTMALELSHRAGLELREYWHVQGEGKTLARKLAVAAISALGVRDSEPFSGSFYYVFARPSSNGVPLHGAG